MRWRDTLSIRIGLGLAALLAALYGVSQAVVMKRFLRLEDQAAGQNVRRVEDALTTAVATVDSKTGEWASWDDTYDFIRGRAPRYIRVNTADNTFRELQLNLMAWLDKSGRLVHGKAFSLSRDREIPLPVGLMESLHSAGPFLRRPSPGRKKAGILLLPGQAIMLSCRPILTSEGKGPALGTLVFGRFLDEIELRRLSNMTHLAFTLQPVAAPDLPGYLAGSERSKGYLARPLGRRTLAAYSLVRNLYGRPAFLLTITGPRAIYAQGQATVRHFLLWVLYLGLACGVAFRALAARLATSLCQKEESDSRYRAVVEQSHEIILLLDARSGEVLEANPAFQRLFGYTPGDLAGLTIFDIAAGDLYAVEISIDRAEGDHHYIGERRYRCKDGVLVDVETSASLIASGSRKAVCLVIRDITERKRAEEQTHRQLQRLSALHDIDLAITASLDLDITLNVLLEHALNQLQVDAACILLLNRRTQTLDCLAERGFRTPLLHHFRQHLGEGYAGQAARDRERILLSSLPAIGDASVLSPILVGEQCAAYCAMPLIAQGQVKGVLEIYHRSALQPHAEWLSYLETLSQQAAIAIDKATLLQDLQATNLSLSLAYDATIEGWSRALDLRDRETEGHTRRVADLTVLLARAFGLPEEEIAHIRRGAILHDIGKMGIPDAILLKPGKLTPEEWNIMRQHPVYARDMLAPIAFLTPALDIPYCHHEKWDGTGYPRGLQGTDIPLAARLFAVVDVWDALRYDRPYRPGWPAKKVANHILSRIGSHFDPQAAEAFLSLMDSLRRQEAA
ncbi:MAG: PAS domain S-box protein [Armatimonadetes bacterium]|nr:PAS domain S-box protein [Armatimonadota bacterium]